MDRLLNAAAWCLVLLLAAADAHAVTIDLVPVGNAGNPNDTATGNLFGGVAYNYRIGAYEVTNAQYAEFLNAKATSDPLGLYFSPTAGSVYQSIVRSGASGGFTYSVTANMGNKPVNFVDWYDSIRFVNWLQNGQGSGDTETGAYTLLGGTPAPSNGNSITRNPGATWFQPNENEWYKAAYYDPTLNGGTGGYWQYPTRSNTEPTPATANGVGDVTNAGANVANHNFGAQYNFLAGNSTTVGGAGPASASYYGTYDQGGNVDEWNEDLLFGAVRGDRGGSWRHSSDQLSSFTQNFSGPTDRWADTGFRLASVPEPSAFALAVLAPAALAVVRRRRSRSVVSVGSALRQPGGPALPFEQPRRTDLAPEGSPTQRIAAQSRSEFTARSAVMSAAHRFSRAG